MALWSCRCADSWLQELDRSNPYLCPQRSVSLVLPDPPRTSQSCGTPWLRSASVITRGQVVTRAFSCIFTLPSTFALLSFFLGTLQIAVQAPPTTHSEDKKLTCLKFLVGLPPWAMGVKPETVRLLSLPGFKDLKGGRPAPPPRFQPS